MQWANESRELDCCVKHLSWTPPWVMTAAGNEEDSPYCYLGQNQTMKDHLGCGREGRIPAAWWTLNHRYNFDVEVQRLGAGEGRSEDEVASMLKQVDDAANRQRYRFVRDSPDLVVYMHALRAELHMRMVMPAILGSSSSVPFLGMARFETGPNGNPHWHGVGYGRGNPRLDVAGTKLLEEYERMLAEVEEGKEEGKGD